MSDLKKIRQGIREARRNIPKNYAHQASLKFAERIATLPDYQNASRIAGFLAFDGEADPRPLMERALLEKKEVYVPIIVGKDQPLRFAPWTKTTKLKKNRFDIFEPDVSPELFIDGEQLECVITPLVAFDEACNRIGVGGGFYDRTFAFRESQTDGKTSLIGVAYELQRLDNIKKETWDVTLTAIVTEMAIYNSK